jgi:hypothetical protein
MLFVKKEKYKTMAVAHRKGLVKKFNFFLPLLYSTKSNSFHSRNAYIHPQKFPPICPIHFHLMLLFVPLFVRKWIFFVLFFFVR